MSAFRTAKRRPRRPGAAAALHASTARAYEGLAGDTLASALLANGVHLVGRSFKYHRPRGILTAGAEEPNALVTVRRDAARETPNLRATQVELYDGLEAHSQNRWPSLALRPRPRERLPVAAVPGGLLLQDLHVAARGLGRALRAADPPRRGARPRAGAAGSGPLRAALRALRRARRRRAGRPGSRPRSRPPTAARA